MPSKVIACIFGLSGFAVAIAAGMGSGNSAARVILQALAALLACFIVGTLVGLAAERVVLDHTRASRPDERSGGSTSATGAR